jgi:xylose isomerase
MIPWKLSVNLAFFGLQRDRYTQYQPARALEEKVRLASQIEGVSGVELKYPFDLENPQLARRLLDEHGLELSAVNVDIKDGTLFRYGALSANSAEARRLVVARLREGMDIAAELGTPLVTTCPLADSYGYPFQIDYTAAWGHLIESVREVASYRPEIRFVLEYQPHDLQAHPLLDSVGKMLYVCAEVGLPNFGANLDIGHSFAGGESPAEAIALLAGQGRLFYMHTNDSTGDGGDWDMLSGSMHLWHWLEILYTLHRLEYAGWLGADIITAQMDPVPAFGANTRMLLRMWRVLERMGLDKLHELVQQDGNTAELFDYLGEQVLGRE